MRHDPIRRLDFLRRQPFVRPPPCPRRRAIHLVAQAYCRPPDYLPSGHPYHLRHRPGTSFSPRRRNRQAKAIRLRHPQVGPLLIRRRRERRGVKRRDRSWATRKNLPKVAPVGSQRWPLVGYPSGQHRPRLNHRVQRRVRDRREYPASAAVKRSHLPVPTARLSRSGRGGGLVQPLHQYERPA